jgi:cell division protein FtsB
MRFLGLALVLLIALIQNPLWFGKGGLLRVHELGAQVEAQRQTNIKLAARNATLNAEVLDLKQGYRRARAFRAGHGQAGRTVFPAVAAVPCSDGILSRQALSSLAPCHVVWRRHGRCDEKNPGRRRRRRNGAGGDTGSQCRAPGQQADRRSAQR